MRRRACCQPARNAAYTSWTCRGSVPITARSNLLARKPSLSRPRLAAEPLVSWARSLRSEEGQRGAPEAMKAAAEAMESAVWDFMRRSSWVWSSGTPREISSSLAWFHAWGSSSSVGGKAVTCSGVAQEWMSEGCSDCSTEEEEGSLDMKKGKWMRVVVLVSTRGKEKKRKKERYDLSFKKCS